MPDLDRALDLLVQASRTFPPLRAAVQTVEDELRRLGAVGCVDMPDIDLAEVDAIPVPRDPWNEIITGLWQGGSMRGGDLSQFDAVLSVGSDADQFAGKPPHVDLIHFPSLDGPMVPERLDAAVDVAFTWGTAGRRVLVHCQAGLNRSGLVVAALLVTRLGWDPDEAIQHIRRRRSPWALCNPVFAAHVRALRPRGVTDA